jgi:hypothetical protein
MGKAAPLDQNRARAGLSGWRNGGRNTLIACSHPAARQRQTATLRGFLFVLTCASEGNQQTGCGVDRSAIIDCREVQEGQQAACRTQTLIAS